MLAGIGVDPIGAVVGCLVVNSTPTAFGSVGVPTVILVSVAGVETMALSTHVAMLQAILVILSPFLLVVIGSRSIKALKGMLPMILIAALSYLIPWYAAACFIGPELPDIIGSICSMVCIVLASRVLNREPAPEYSIEVSGETEGHSFSVGEGLKAWCPFVLIFILLMATSNPVRQSITRLPESKLQCRYTAVKTPESFPSAGSTHRGDHFCGSHHRRPGAQGSTPGVMAEVLAETLKKY